MVRKNTPSRRGNVTIVGAGPGAVDLITLRGRSALEQADVVIHDALANLDLLHFCPPEVEVHDVGKRCNSHKATQNEINGLMIEKALSGRRVVRLKGGDPSIFARLSEETAALDAEGITYEIVPGVTAACATAATLGTSLTSRDLAPGTVFVTGHECASRAAAGPVDWRALAKLGMTLCIYMGVRELPAIASLLIEEGMSPSTPLTMVANASRPDEIVLSGQLSDAPAFSEGLRGNPAMILIGTPVESRLSVAASSPRLEAAGSHRVG